MEFFNILRPSYIILKWQVWWPIWTSVYIEFALMHPIQILSRRMIKYSYYYNYNPLPQN